MNAQSIRRQVLTSALMLLVVTVALGFGYPLVVTGISQLLFRHQANGSLIYSKGKLTGSALLGQSFTSGAIPCRSFSSPGRPRTTTTVLTRERPTSARTIRNFSRPLRNGQWPIASSTIFRPARRCRSTR